MNGLIEAGIYGDANSTHIFMTPTAARGGHISCINGAHFYYPW